MFDHIADIVQRKPKVRRSRHWREVRKEHLKANPTCKMCGGRKRLQVHHILPVHLYPSLELDRTNLITLCRGKKYGVDCHLLIGHLGDFKTYNPSPETMIFHFLNRDFKGYREVEK